MAVDLRGSAVRRYAPPVCLARVSDALRCQCAIQRNGVVVVVSLSGLHYRKVMLQLAFRLCFVRRSTAYTLEKWRCTEKPLHVLLYNVMCVCGHVNTPPPPHAHAGLGLLLHTHFILNSS